MEKKQTAVEWLVDEMINQMGIRIENTEIGIQLFNQAIEMEKEQIIDAHDAAYIAMNLAFRGFDRSVEYYENTYGKE